MLQAYFGDLKLDAGVILSHKDTVQQRGTNLSLRAEHNWQYNELR